MNYVKALFLLAALFVTPSLSAQNFGLKAGVLLNDMEQKLNIIGDDQHILNVQPDLSIGYLLGGMYRAKFNNFFSLQTEISYQQKGGKLRNFDNSKTKLHYLDLSVLGLFKIVDDTTIDFGISNSYIKKEFIKPHDVGLIGGVSHFVSKKVELSMRYFYGLRPIHKTTFTDVSGADGGALTLHNRNVQLSVGYYFL